MEEPEKVTKETEDEEPDVEGHRSHKRDDAPTVEREKPRPSGDETTSPTSKRTSC